MQSFAEHREVVVRERMGLLKSGSIVSQTHESAKYAVRKGERVRPISAQRQSSVTVKVITKGVVVKSVERQDNRVQAPPRRGKHTLFMSSKGNGPKYQGVDEKGVAIWGDVTEVATPKVSHKATKIPKPKGEPRATRVSKVKVELTPLVFGNYSMVRPGVFKREAVAL